MRKESLVRAGTGVSSSTPGRPTVDSETQNRQRPAKPTQKKWRFTNSSHRSCQGEKQITETNRQAGDDVKKVPDHKVDAIGNAVNLSVMTSACDLMGVNVDGQNYMCAEKIQTSRQ
jgi:hypothetical protein